MGCLLALLAGFAPRVALALVWIFTNLVYQGRRPVSTAAALLQQASRVLNSPSGHSNRMAC
jgi:hypothetical protein